MDCGEIVAQWCLEIIHQDTKIKLYANTQKWSTWTPTANAKIRHMTQWTVWKYSFYILISPTFSTHQYFNKFRQKNAKM